MVYISKCPLTQKGSTLVELLLYISIASTILLSLSAFVSTAYSARAERASRLEVEQQAELILERIASITRYADNIVQPSTGTESARLELSAYDSTKNPTSIYLNAENIFIKEGSSNEVQLNNSDIEITGLKFTNNSGENTPGIIKIELKVKFKTTSQRREFKYESTYVTSEALR